MNHQMRALADRDPDISAERCVRCGLETRCRRAGDDVLLEWRPDREAVFRERESGVALIACPGVMSPRSRIGRRRSELEAARVSSRAAELGEQVAAYVQRNPGACLTQIAEAARLHKTRVATVVALMAERGSMRVEVVGPRGKLGVWPAEGAA